MSLKIKSLQPMTLIAGPCIIEDEGLTLEIAQELKKQLMGLSVEFYFKASFDKANRTSIDGYRGPGMKKGLEILSRVKNKTGLALCTDFHEPSQAQEVVEVVDMIQVPAFLCRQTDMIRAAVDAALSKGRRLNIKKGQFLAPWDVKNIIEKVRAFEKEQKPGKQDWFMITERGVNFGYNSLVVDMASFQCMQGFKVPVIYDATHSVQQPGAGSGGKSTGGRRELIEVLARAAVAAGADGIFLECHPHPDKAKSDGPNAFYLEHVGAFIMQLLTLKTLIDQQPKLCPEARKA